MSTEPIPNPAYSSVPDERVEDFHLKMKALQSRITRLSSRYSGHISYFDMMNQALDLFEAQQVLSSKERHEQDKALCQEQIR